MSSPYMSNDDDDVIVVDVALAFTDSVNSSYLLGGNFPLPESQIFPEKPPKPPKKALNLPPDMWFPQNTGSRIHTGIRR